MRFFKEVIEGQSNLFYRKPSPFTKYTNKQQLRYCVGAALYMPATREMIAQEIIEQKHPSLTTIVLDLEDALGDLQVEVGITQLLTTLNTLQEALNDGQLLIENLPLLFIRVRNTKQLQNITKLLGELQHLLTGYVLPKFTKDNGEAYLEVIAKQNELGYNIYAMPILESVEILQKETRIAQLGAIRALLARYEDYILNVRIGSTDFCGLLGVRRTIRHTIYDIQSVRDCITDIFNMFLREGPQFVLSGSVWEYFGPDERALTGLIREVELDRLNGLIGKTIIHPSHIDSVNAMYVIPHEDFIDAQGILLQSDGKIGVQKSEYGNKMNEMKPHYIWAKRIFMQAEAFGVFNPHYNYTHLLKSQVQV